jgi:hypothetical protein
MSEHRACVAHCRACDRCFACVRSFDAHRVGPWTDRTCIDPEGELRFSVKTRDGRCPSSGRTGVVLWSSSQRCRETPEPPSASQAEGGAR